MAIVNSLSIILESLSDIPFTLESGLVFNPELTTLLMKNSPFFIRPYGVNRIELVNSNGEWLLHTSTIERCETSSNGYVCFLTASNHKYQFTVCEKEQEKPIEKVSTPVVAKKQEAKPNTYKKVVYRYTEDHEEVPAWFHGKYEKNTYHGMYGDSDYYTIHLIGTYYVPIDKWDKEEEDWAKERDLIRIGTVSFDSDFVDSVRSYKTKIIRSNEFAFEYRKELRKEARERLNPNKDKEKADFIRWALTSD